MISNVRMNTVAHNSKKLGFGDYYDDGKRWPSADERLNRIEGLLKLQNNFNANTITSIDSTGNPTLLEHNLSHCRKSSNQISEIVNKFDIMV